MAIIQRRTLLILMVISLGVVLFLGIRMYHIIFNSRAFSQEELKYYAETVLYLALLSMILLAAAFIAVLLKSRSVLKELDKIIDLTRIGNISIDEPLKRIGRLGEKIRSLYYQINELNEKRSLKISSLSAINAFLLNNLDMSLLVLDVMGKITDTTRKFLEKADTESESPIGRYISEVYPDVIFHDIMQEFEKTRNLIEGTTRDRLSFFPIFNRMGELSNVICIIGKEKIFTNITIEKMEKATPMSKLSALMKRVVPFSK